MSDIREAYFVIGMAGSGKTTLVGKLRYYLSDVFVVNLDPAVYELPYVPDVDIRETVDYDALISERQLGPNGAILTALNLFAAAIDQLIKLIPHGRPLLLDAPGYIEAFAWSASGEVLLRAFPRAVCLYVVDAARCADPAVFVSSMIYLLSIYHRFGINYLTVVMNKRDLLTEPVNDHVAAIYAQNADESEDGGKLGHRVWEDIVRGYTSNSLLLNDVFALYTEDDYQSSYLSNLSLFLDSFWQQNVFAFVSCYTCHGIDALLTEMAKASRAQNERYDSAVYEAATQEKHNISAYLRRFNEEFDDTQDVNYND